VIYTDSRYATALIAKTYDTNRDDYFFTAFREFPTATASFYYYTWVENDRIDLIANEFLGSPESWWKIMDFNPEIIDPFDIQVGTVVRIPNAL
jgi:hypothetical protein